CDRRLQSRRVLLRWLRELNVARLRLSSMLRDKPTGALRLSRSPCPQVSPESVGDLKLVYRTVVATLRAANSRRAPAAPCHTRPRRHSRETCRASANSDATRRLDCQSCLRRGRGNL